MGKISTRPTVAYKPRPGEIPTTPGCTASGMPRAGCCTWARRRTSARGSRTTSLRCAPCMSARGAWSPAASVEWTVVASDVEALQLEYIWIKEFDPPFNVSFRDDKSYPFMAITLADEAPRVIVTRNRRIPGAKYFGPYPKVWAVRETIDLMIKVFPIRTCTDASYKRAMADRATVFPRPDRPVRRALLAEGDDRGAPRDRRRLRRLHGRPRPAVRKELTPRMSEASAAMDYEAAARLPRPARRARGGAVQERARACGRHRRRLFGIAQDELAAAVQQFVVRGGRVRGVRATMIEKELDISAGELVDQVLERAYGDSAPPTSHARSSCRRYPTTPPSSRRGCATRRGRRVSIQVARRGEQGRAA